MTDDQITRTARDLSALIDLSAALEAQAIAKANDRDHLPGGAAMVALGPVASHEAWVNTFDTAERLGRDTSYISDDDEDFAPPLQLLLFWSEAIRLEQGQDYGQRPTIQSEASYLKFALDHLWATEPRFEDFAKDVEKAKTQIENLLSAGKRSQRGVQCFDCSVDLIRDSRDPRKIHHCDGHDGVCGYPHKFCPHDRGGLADEWVCPSCNRRYDVEAYGRAVSHAHFVFAEYLPLQQAMERTGAPRGSIQAWATRGLVRKRKDQDSGRVTYHIGDIEERDTESVA